MSNLDLAKRAVACKHWRWMPGMLAKNAHNTVRVDGHVHGEPFIYSLCQFSGEREGRFIREMPLPDLTDAATLGCLEQLVCDAHGVPVWLEPDWRKHGNEIFNWSAVAFRNWLDVPTVGHGPSKAAAWVSALEAASC